MFKNASPGQNLSGNEEQSLANGSRLKLYFALGLATVIAVLFLIQYEETRDKYPDLTTDGVLYKGKQAWDAGNYSVSLGYYDEACRRGSQVGCYNYALQFINGAGVAKNPKRGLNIMLKTCENGSGFADACNYAGYMLANGLGVNKDPDRAWKILDSVCAMNNVVTCESTRKLIRRNGNLPSYSTAEADMRRKLDSDGSVSNLRAYLLRFPESGYAGHVRQQLSSDAQSYFQKGEAAVNKQDVAEAEEYFIYACQDGSGISCASVGDIYYVESEVAENPRAFSSVGRDISWMQEMASLSGSMVVPVKAPVRFDVARGYYKWGCEGGYGYGCIRLADLYEAGKGGTSDHAKSKELVQQGIGLMNQACDSGDLKQCGQLGVMYALGLFVPRNAEAATPLIDKACQGGNENACVMFASELVQGSSVEKVVTWAVGLLEHACSANNMLACQDLAGFYISGQGVSKDLQRAKELLIDPCRHGIQNACQKLEQVSAEMSISAPSQLTH